MPNNQIELGEFTYALADMDVQGTTPSRVWTATSDPIDLGPGAHVAEVYAEITAFDLDGGTDAGPDPGTRVGLGLVTSPGTSPDIWQIGSDTAPNLMFPGMPTLPQGTTIGAGILSRYVQVALTIVESTTEPGANTTIAFNMSVLITSS